MRENKKVTSAHLSRDAYLYIRQSSLKQVVGNQESTKRQYDLRNRAVALGWSHEQIIVIDSDQGQSGAESTNREGFQELVARVGMGKAGIVMGLEVSRLARNSSDWHRLLEICALADTLILDEDGIYDPSHFNDRLLLGLKGTMSEAELHILRMRLRGGILNKARRGELKFLLPVGFSYDTEGRVVLDPDKQVQDSIMLLFKTFERCGSAYSVVKYFRENGLKFPKRPRTGLNTGKLLWGKLSHSNVLRLLHNPRYAGIYTYGRTKSSTNQSTKKFQKKNLKRDQWLVFLPESHKGYISQDQYELNQRKLLENAQAIGMERRKSPPREGPALLQGIVICGSCGRRMTVEYRKSRKSKTGLSPVYVCLTNHVESRERKCQRIPGSRIDDAVSDLLVKMMTPVTIEVALSVQQEIESHVTTTDHRPKNGPKYRI
jgi:DNA invertase Pin-like site-specific DNA recombinase